MISNGEVITSEERMDDFVEVMLGDRFPIDFDLGHSPYDPSEFAYWPYYLITAGEVITDDEDATDLLDTMMGYEKEFDEDYDYEPDVDESQEWHDFDPDC